MNKYWSQREISYIQWQIWKANIKLDTNEQKEILSFWKYNQGVFLGLSADINKANDINVIEI